MQTSTDDKWYFNHRAVWEWFLYFIWTFFGNFSLNDRKSETGNVNREKEKVGGACRKASWHKPETSAPRMTCKLHTEKHLPRIQTSTLCCEVPTLIAAAPSCPCLRTSQTETGTFTKKITWCLCCSLSFLLCCILLLPVLPAAAAPGHSAVGDWTHPCLVINQGQGIKAGEMRQSGPADLWGMCVFWHFLEASAHSFCESFFFWGL